MPVLLYRTRVHTNQVVQMAHCDYIEDYDAVAPKLLSEILANILNSHYPLLQVFKASHNNLCMGIASVE